MCLCIAVGREANLQPLARLPSWAMLTRAMGWFLVVGGVLVTCVVTFSTLRLVYTANHAIAVVLSDVASKGESVRIVPGKPVGTMEPIGYGCSA